MAFEVADFETFMEILGAHPEWQSRLRKMLLDDELAESRRAMNEGFARLTATIESFANETRPRLDTLESDVATLKADVATIKVDLGQLKGESKETWYRNRVAAIFGSKLDGTRAIAPAEIGPVKAALRSGAISQADWDDLALLDLIVAGRDDDGNDLYIGIEISASLDEGDVVRAIRRTNVLRKAGIACVPAIAGPATDTALAETATRQGVAVLRDGLVISWPGAA